MKTITSGSFSRLDDYESCALKARYKYVDRIPEPDRGPPPRGLKEWHNDRGNRIHDEAEQFIKGAVDALPNDLNHFSEEMWQARILYEQGRATAEEMWCYDDDWQPVAASDYEATRFRMKADLTVELGPTHRLCVDFKTGKRYGNEVKHEKQKQTYAIGMFLRMPELTKVTTEVWYLDLPDEDVYASILTRKQAFVLLRGLKARNERMTSATIFPPSPNQYNCRWCPYKEGPCEVAVTWSKKIR